MCFLLQDGSDPAVLAGQCKCKDQVTGRQCTQCQPGYYDLRSSHATGCIDCGCDVRGAVNGDVMCDVTSGQCRCKRNVMGRTCNQCKAMFYNLSIHSTHGCQPCLCNMSGSRSQECDQTIGQCPCKNHVSGRRCDQCDLGYHSFHKSGCQSCQCSESGTRLGALYRCDQVSGQCQCKNYVSGYRCDRCMAGYYKLQESNPNGCIRCLCDTRGISMACNDVSGSCTCKRNVTGSLCNQCRRGFYNLTSSNPSGCQPCQCYARGTQEGDRRRPEELNCGGSSGQCLCHSNVRGLKCDQCDVGFVWNQAGQGCVSCR